MCAYIRAQKLDTMVNKRCQIRRLTRDLAAFDVLQTSIDLYWQDV